MENIFKNFVYTGVGIVALTKEKFQKTVDKLVKEDKISIKEGKKIVEDFFKNTDSKREELENNLSEAVNKVIKRFSFASAKDVEELSNRIETLEEVLTGKKPEEKTEEKEETEETEEAK